MKDTILKIVVCCILFSMSTEVKAQETSFPIKEMNIPSNALTLGIGSAVAADYNNPGAIFLNPAVLSTVQKNSLMLSIMPEWVSFRREGLHFVRAGMGSSISFGFERISNLRNGSWQWQNPRFPDYLDTYSMVFAFPSSSPFSLGFGAHFRNQHFFTKNEFGYGIDAGFIIMPVNFLSFGGYFKNFTGSDNTKSESMSFSIANRQAGAGISFHHEELHFKFNADVLYDFDSGKFDPVFGMEFQFKGLLFPRIGYGKKQFFAGLGVELFDLGFHYSYTNSNSNPSHYFTLVHHFGTDVKNRKEAKNLFSLANDALARGETDTALNLIKQSYLLDSLNQDISTIYYRLKNMSTVAGQSTEQFSDVRGKSNEDRTPSSSAILRKPINLGPVINSERNEGLPAVTADGQIMFFTSDREGTGEKVYGIPSEDFWVAVMKDSVWQPPKNLGNVINTIKNEGACSISSDGQTIFFSKISSDSVGGLDLYMSKLQGTTWSEPVSLGENVNSPYWDSHPSISNDRYSLYFASSRKGGYGGYDIWVTHYVDNKWTKPENLGPKINTPYHEWFPFIFFDSKTLYFSSNRPGGFGGFDIYMAKLDENGEWSDPVNLGPQFNSSLDEKSFIIEPSGEWCYFASDRLGGYGGLDIYKTRVPKQMQPDRVVTIKGILTDNKGNPIGGILQVSDQETGEVLFRAEANSETGEYMLTLPPGRLYNLSMSGGDNYIRREEKLDLTNVKSYQQIKQNFSLYEAPKKIFIEGRVSDYYTDEPIGALIKVEVLETGEEIATFYSNYANGRYRVEVPVDRNYNMAVSADNYFFESAKIHTRKELADKKTIRKDFRLKLVKVGEKVKINNILFDVDKASLRPEAYVELNRAVELLKKYQHIGIEIHGHTDSTGSEAHNLALSQERCDSVKQYLVDHGIEPYRILTVGHGESQPVADNKTEEGRQLNRRTEFVIIEAKEMKNIESKIKK